MDILCQAKSGMGKTAVFVLATLQQLDAVDGQVSVLVMCHTRELAFQISKEYERFSKYMPSIKCSVFFGGMSITQDEKTLKSNSPHIVVGTPGRILALVRSKKLSLKGLKHFILDECDKMLEQLGKDPLLESSGKNDKKTQKNTKITQLPPFRYATRRSGDLQIYSSRETGHDVQCYSLQRHSSRVQEVHARCKQLSWSFVPPRRWLSIRSVLTLKHSFQSLSSSLDSCIWMKFPILPMLAFSVHEFPCQESRV